MFIVRNFYLSLSLVASSVAFASSVALDDKTYTSGSGLVETCRLLRDFPFPTPDGQSVYTPKDFENIEELCSLNIYPNSEKDIGLCAKNYNTQPALEFYKLPKDMDKESFEKEECHKSGESGGRLGDKLAKHKQNVYGMQMDSGLIYFHLSRLLGAGSTLVPVATYRTIDKDVVLEYAEYGRQSGGTTSGGWRILRDKINRKSENVLVSPDLQLVKGSLQQNVKGEGYSNYFRGNENAISSSFFDFATSSSPISSLLAGPKATALEIEKIQKAQDVSLAIFLDYTLQQNDRHSANCHARAYFTYRDAEGKLLTERLSSEEYAAYKKLKKKTPVVLPSQVFAEAKSKVKEEVPENALILERLLLKDNDDGLETKRPFASYLSKVRHLSPLTFARMKWLASLLRNAEHEPVIKKHFTQVIGVSDAAYLKFKNNYLAAVKSFEERESRKELFLDLSFESFI